MTNCCKLQAIMASCSLSNPGFRGPLVLHKTQFLGQNHLTILSQRTISTTHRKTVSAKSLTPKAKFDLSELLGGRGLCNGEIGLQQELKKVTENPPQNTGNPSETTALKEEGLGRTTEVEGIPEDAFEKELFGLTGGFPGGEKGLQKFIEGYPLHDLIEAEKHARAKLIPMPIKKIKLPELKLKLPQLSSFPGNNRNR